MAYTGVITDVFTTIDQLAANQQKDVDDMMHLLYPYQRPLFTHLYFSKNSPAKVVTNENGKFDWFEDEFYPHQTTVSSISGGSASEDAITVGDSTIFIAGDMCLVEATDELVYVDSVTGGDVDITSMDGGDITAASSGYIKIIGSRNHEWAEKRTAASTKEVEKSNYLTIHSETVSTTGRWQAGKRYTNSSTHQGKLAKKIRELNLKIERNFMFSTESGTVTVSSKYRHTYGYGLLGMITTNVVPYLSLDEDALDAYLQTVFAKGSGNKRHYAGSDQVREINKIVKDKFEVTNLTKEYGIDLTTYLTPWGKLKLIWDPVMDGKFTNYGFTIDEDSVNMRYMANDEKGSRKFRVEENVETPGQDGTEDKIIADVGVEVTNEEECGIFYKSV